MKKNPNEIIVYKQFMSLKIQKTKIQQRKHVLVVFDDMIADVEPNKNIKPLNGELFLRGGKLIIYPVFISQTYFVVPKAIRLNKTRYFIMKTLK